MLLEGLKGIFALAFELAALVLLLADVDYASDVQLAGVLLLHGVASLLLAGVVIRWLPAAMAQPRGPLLALLAACAYVLPGLGFVGVLAGVFYLRLHRVSDNHLPFESVQLPDFDPHQKHATGFRVSGLRSFLGNAEASLSSRLGGMVALQYVSGKVASPLLRDLLSDNSEDIRLLAYGMLDAQEKRINQLIHQASLDFAAAGAASMTDSASPDYLRAAEKLSDLYWELIYQELALGDLRRYAIAESLRYCELVLAERNDNAALNLRRGRLLHELGESTAAEQAYERARVLGMPATRILPYLAELRFEAGDYPAVRRLIAELGQWGSLPRLRPVINYWTKQ
ncbi:MAG: hypothetical protein PHT48_09295 [Dechloromonas sp.]|nr:hypothetical protein [Dechloromonas sp.]